MGLEHLSLGELIRPLDVNDSGFEHGAELVRRRIQSPSSKNEIIDRICEFARTYRSSCSNQASSNYQMIRYVLEREDDLDVICRILQARQDFDWCSGGNLFSMFENRWSKDTGAKVVAVLERVACHGEYLFTRYSAVRHLKRIGTVSSEAAVERCLASSRLLNGLVEWVGFNPGADQKFFPSGGRNRRSLEFFFASLHFLLDAAEENLADQALLICAARTTIDDDALDTEDIDGEGHSILKPARFAPVLHGWLSFLRSYVTDPDGSDYTESLYPGRIADWVLKSKLPDPSARTCLIQAFPEHPEALVAF